MLVVQVESQKLVQVAPKVHPFMEKFRKVLPFQLNRETILIVLL